MKSYPKKSPPFVPVCRSPFDEAASAFKRGGVIAFPTETFYGLGVDPFNINALEKLFALKGRVKGKPVALIIKDASMLASVASDVSQEAMVLMDKFWPGP
ncbi:MAG: Sua5/YciO/YrdC/YwlC family protein, partial [Deltaproteobacteria bacterium]